MNWTYFIIMAYACFLYYVKSADFNCTEGEDCIVSCNGTDACKHANINCPSDARCDIQCIGARACDRATFNWNNPVAGTGSLTCDGNYACSEVQYPTPLPDEALNVTCDNYNECYYATIVCPTNARCDIKCIGEYACDSANINCPSDARCDIQCIGGDACDSATLNWNNPVAGTGSLTCDGEWACSEVQYPIPLPYEDLSVTCDNLAECYYATIECPTNARCDIQCIGVGACEGAILNWNNPIAGTGSLTCDGDYACSEVQYPTPLPDEAVNITCDNYNECAWATIVCPTNAECRVICSVDEACREATIESCGELVVTCAPNACTNKEEICTTSPPTSQPTSQPTTATSAPTTATSPPTQPTSAPTADNSSDANDNAFVYFCSCIFFLVMLFV